MPLVDEATIDELYEPVFVGWARFLRRPVPARSTVQNWAWKASENGFPPPRGERRQARGNRPARTYDVGAILLWYVWYTISCRL